MSILYSIYYRDDNVYIVHIKKCLDAIDILGGKRMRKSVKEFLTVQEIAREMRVSWKTVVRLIQSGELPAIKFGRSYRILKTDYQEYLKKRSIQPPDTTP